MAKTIWIINQYAGSEFHGKHYRSYYLAKELVKKGHEVFIISSSHAHQFSEFPEVRNLVTFKKLSGINYCWVRTRLYPESRSIKRALSMLGFTLKLIFFPKKKLVRPDAIMVSSPSPVPVLVASRWCKKF
ncbi:MAG: glycosyltransferase WbuB, partial [Marinilabiliales bacterium]